MPRIYYPIRIVHHPGLNRFAVSFLLFFVSFFILNSQIAASVVLDPQADFYRCKGLEDQQKGKYRSALNFYLKALAIAPESALLYNDIGVVYEHLGNPDRAEQYYLHVLKLDDHYLPAYSNIAYLYLAEGHLDKAKQFFWERLKRAPLDDPGREKIRQELYRLDPSLKASAIKRELEETARRLEEEAQQKAKEEFVLNVERAEKHYRRGQKMRQAARYRKAVAEFDKALKVTPDNPKIIKAKELAQYEERMDEVKQRIDAATDNLDSGEVDSAKKEFQRILAIIPKEAVDKSEH